jgi:hypothetical protein
VRPTIKEQHILAGGGSVSETVAQVEDKAPLAQQAGCRGPLTLRCLEVEKTTFISFAMLLGTWAILLAHSVIGFHSRIACKALLSQT